MSSGVITPHEAIDKAVAMVSATGTHHSGRRYSDLSVYGIADRLIDEADELGEAAAGGERIEIVEEMADVLICLTHLRQRTRISEQELAEAVIRKLRARSLLTDRCAGDLADVERRINVRPGQHPAGEMFCELRDDLLRVYATGLAEIMESLTSEGYVAARIKHDTHGPLVLTLQKDTGKTPGEIAREARAQADEAAAILAQIMDALPPDNDHLPLVDRVQRLIAEYRRAVRKCESELEFRFKYQHTVYEACQEIDRIRGNSLADGDGCTRDELVREIRKLGEELRSAQADICDLARELVNWKKACARQAGEIGCKVVAAEAVP